jgi:Helix-turn-helix domain
MNKLLTTAEAAKFLGVHPGTLTVWRVWRRGPKFMRRGRRVFYRKSELIKWSDKVNI